jgi:gamma-glutamyl-gamma-aminobutyrate hydrolase PuuD
MTSVENINSSISTLGPTEVFIPFNDQLSFRNVITIMDGLVAKGAWLDVTMDFDSDEKPTNAIVHLAIERSGLELPPTP